MRKNMKKLTVATVIGAMTVTALAPVSAQAKDKTLTVAIWACCQDQFRCAAVCNFRHSL